MCVFFYEFYFFFVKQKTAYDMRISDWSSDVCSSDLDLLLALMVIGDGKGHELLQRHAVLGIDLVQPGRDLGELQPLAHDGRRHQEVCGDRFDILALVHHRPHGRSEEHTSELQSLMRISYAVFCLKKKNKTKKSQNKQQQ